MVRTCGQCRRLNPEAALYCYFDGLRLEGQGPQSGPVDVGKQPFPHPFVFTSGRSCRNFDELALACDQLWDEARELLCSGLLASFFGGLGRADLAVAARTTVQRLSGDQALDDFLGRLPGSGVSGPKLRVEPSEINLGQLKPGRDQQTEVELSNEGHRLLHGSAAVAACDWMHLGDGAGAPAKLFQFTHCLRLRIQVLGKALRASAKPLEGKIVCETSGGMATIMVRAEVPVTPFTEGVLAGAQTPRALALKAKAATREAVPLFENGAVARWYEANGWSYPVLGPASSGLGAIQQFFEALGLVQPPPVEISETSVALAGRFGETLQHNLRLTTVVKRPIYAHAASDQAWLKIGKVTLKGQVADIPLEAIVPDRPGETFEATATVTTNGQKRFKVAVTLEIAGVLRLVPEEPAPVPSSSMHAPAPAKLPMSVPTARAVQPARPAVDTAERAWADARRWPAWLHAMPLLIVCLTLAGIIVHDIRARAVPPAPAVVTHEEVVVDSRLHIGVLFHDHADALIEEPSRRFGLVMLREQDPRNPRKRKKLTYDELGRSNNVCLMIDGKEQLFGHKLGVWRTFSQNKLLDPDPADRQGESSVWFLAGPQLEVKQHVEVIRGEQTRRLDTCLIHYSLVNRDDRPHIVGLRFLLDTFIGANDGVPFTIPGQKTLCDTMLEFTSSASLPDFIQALERQDLENPGTVAHLQLKLGGRFEPPSRLTLGAWPDGELKKQGKAATALAQLTGWEVPVLPIHTLSPGDSAVTIYWDPKPLPPGGHLDLGFSYGLGAFAGSEGEGKLAVTVGGSFRPGGEFTVTTYVKSGTRQTVKLELPEGMRLIDGAAEQPVPAAAGGASARSSPVTWKVQAPNRPGDFTLRVALSTGAAQTQRVSIRANRLFD